MNCRSSNDDERLQVLGLFVAYVYFSQFCDSEQIVLESRSLARLLEKISRRF